MFIGIKLLSFYQQLASSERMCWSREFKLLTPERKLRRVNNCANQTSAYETDKVKNVRIESNIELN